MSAYLFTFRSPDHYAPDSGTFEEWSRWQLELGARLMDRGNPAFAAAAVGADPASTTLGGYSQTAWETYLPRLAVVAAGGDPGPDPHD